MVSGDNRRLYAANEAGCDCSIVIRDPSDPLPSGGTYGKNLKKIELLTSKKWFTTS